MLGKLRIKFLIDRRVERGGEHLFDLVKRRPYVAQIDVVAVAVLTDRFGVDIVEHGTRERKCDDQRRRHKEIGLDVLMNAGLEVAITGKYRSRDKVVINDLLFDRRIERARISDTGRASVSDKVKSDLVKILL